MRDQPIILSGLLLFLAAVTFPFWHNLAAKPVKAPELRMPVTSRQCVAPAAFMKSSHMELLARWREQAVRDGRRSFISAEGKAYNIGLTGTCLTQCHTSKPEFCDRCHSYVGLTGPYCWDCHNAPQPVESSAP